MSDRDQRLAAVEARLESAFALDTRLKSIEGDLRKLRSSGVRDWLQTLGPYVAGLVVLIVGYAIKDSVTLALQREQLDLEYVKQMRDLMKDFDEAQTQAAANANAIGLAMYGRFAIVPLVERLEEGDLAHLAAERGLRLIGSNEPVVACPRFARIVADEAGRYSWQTHNTMIKVMGQSECPAVRAALEKYAAELTALGSDAQRIASFGQRYSDPDGFDIESISTLKTELSNALQILSVQVEP